jgi:hypothetical protein
MRISWLLVVCTAALASFAALAARTDPPAQKGPQLLFPSDYRQWVYLSSGLDMKYKTEVLPCEPSCPPLFENVFVRPDAYSAFLKNRVWPTGTVMVLEKRCAAKNVSIDTNGSVQEKLYLVAASQKAAENGWNYYIFGYDPKSNCAGPDPDFSGQQQSPISNSDPAIAGECWQCHHDNGKIDNTFTQFYPTLNRLTAQKKSE